MSKYIEVNGRRIGEGYPAYIIAEMSANHLQDYERAKKIISAAKKAGADAIKLQSYRPDTITIDCQGKNSWQPREVFGKDKIFISYMKSIYAMGVA